jgi:hypothetical protein
VGFDGLKRQLSGRFIVARVVQLAALLTNFIDGPLSPLKIFDLRPGGTIFTEMPRFVSAYSLPIFSCHSGVFYEKRLAGVKTKMLSGKQMGGDRTDRAEGCVPLLFTAPTVLRDNRLLFAPYFPSLLLLVPGEYLNRFIPFRLIIDT